MAPPLTAAGAGVVVQAAIAIGVTAFAVAVPPFVTASVVVNTWCVLTCVALGVRVAPSDGGVWTVTLALTVPVDSTF
ncbi:MAG TPA: hypothetical protein VMT17_11145 [Anaeromyxobacteraceae bacterium]|nr:hypothetical protein [Anaeromyxobacteraceae bacterium]